MSELLAAEARFYVHSLVLVASLIPFTARAAVAASTHTGHSSCPQLLQSTEFLIGRNSQQEQQKDLRTILTDFFTRSEPGFICRFLTEQANC